MKVCVGVKGIGGLKKVSLVISHVGVAGWGWFVFFWSYVLDGMVPTKGSRS